MGCKGLDYYSAVDHNNIGLGICFACKRYQVDWQVRKRNSSL